MIRTKVHCNETMPRETIRPDATGEIIDIRYLQATGFVLQPGGLVAQAVYSTGPVGRYVASDVISLIDYLSKTPR